MEEPTKQLIIEVKEGEEGARLDAWVASKVADLTRSKVQKILEQQLITVNEKFVSGKTKVQQGDLVKISELDSSPSSLSPKKVHLDILYEDDQLVVINKPSGLVVHPGAGTVEPTLAEGLLYHYGELARSSGGDSWMRPGIVHRLDKDTSGVMVCAKTDVAMSGLAQQFSDKTNQREYLCLMNGVLKEDLTVRESYFYRDPQSRLKFKSMEIEDYEEHYGTMEKPPKKFRWAKTLFKREAVFANRLSLATAKLYTGRTHQIRIHSRDLKAAILGDALYSTKTMLPSYFSDDLVRRVDRLQRQMLHGRLLGFTHPTTHEKMQFLAELPEDFRTLIDKLMPYRI